MANKNDYNKNQSRKWRLVLLVIILATLGTFVPPLISLWVLKAKEALFLISGAEWVSVITLVVSAYFGINVWQKKIEGNQNVSENNGSATTTVNIDAEISTKTGDEKIVVVNEEGEA